MAALKFIPDWFLTSEMLEKLDNALHANDDILFYNEDFDKVTLFACHRHILAVDLDKVNLDDDKNFSEDDSDTLIHIRLLAGHNGFKKRKVLNKKIGEELIPIAWHPKRWWNFCMAEDEKKRNRTNFYRTMLSKCISSMQYGSIETFCHTKTFYSSNIFENI